LVCSDSPEDQNGYDRLVRIQWVAVVTSGWIRDAGLYRIETAASGSWSKAGRA